MNVWASRIFPELGRRAARNLLLRANGIETRPYIPFWFDIKPLFGYTQSEEDYA